ncbi:MAG: NAD(P)/FAD-dependent oxidoreductase, partial [Janthinobacterium lividum]
IIGGGPAGATAAALLALRGHHVTVLDKAGDDRHERGELLAPSIHPLLGQLGVAGAVHDMALAAGVIEFCTPVRRTQVSAVQGPQPGLLVERRQFDDVLLRNAQDKGAAVIGRCRVTHLQFKPNGGGATVFARQADGEPASWNARFVLDASGRDCVLGSQLKSRKRRAGKADTALTALFCPPPGQPPKAEPHAGVFWFEHGWLWAHSLADGRIHVGAVLSPAFQQTRSVPLDEFLLATIQLCAPLQAWLGDAALAAAVYGSECAVQFCGIDHGECYLLLGDAHAAIHPVFAAGVTLAMHGAAAAADVADRCLRRPAEAAGARQHFTQQARARLGSYLWFSQRMDDPASHPLWKTIPQALGMRQAFVGLLAGALPSDPASEPSSAAHGGAMFVTLRGWYHAAAIGMLLGRVLRVAGAVVTGRTRRAGARQPDVLKP